MSPAAEERLHRHVDQILAAASVPRAQVDDVAQELMGHLVEKAEALVAVGESEDAAVTRAIAEFGGPGELGPALTGAMRSRIWASTIGVLVPPRPAGLVRPGVIWWLRLVLALEVVLIAVGLAGRVATAPPLTAVAALASMVVGAGATLIAFRAVDRGQRWALWYAIWIAALFVVFGAWDALHPAQPQTVTIPLGAILGGAVLLGALGSRPALRTYMRASRPLSLAASVGIVVALIVPPTLPMLAAGADPTQAGPDDLTLRLALACRDGTITAGSSEYPVRRADLTISASWRRADLLPRGLAGLLASQDETADTLGLRGGAAGGAAWLWDEDPAIRDEVSGETAGWWGSTSPSWSLIPDDVPGGLSVAIPASAIRSGHTITVAWHLYREMQGEAGPDSGVDVFYAHLDRFVLFGSVGCNETAVAHHILPVFAGSPMCDAEASLTSASDFVRQAMAALDAADPESRRYLAIQGAMAATEADGLLRTVMDDALKSSVAWQALERRYEHLLAAADALRPDLATVPGRATELMALADDDRRAATSAGLVCR